MTPIPADASCAPNGRRASRSCGSWPEGRPWGTVALLACGLTAPVAAQAPGHQWFQTPSPVGIDSEEAHRPSFVQEGGSHWIAGALIGAGVGGLGFWLLYEVADPGLCEPHDNSATSTCSESGPGRAESILIGAGLGAVVGGVLGYVLKTELSLAPFGTVTPAVGLGAEGRLTARLSVSRDRSPIRPRHRWQ